jgi:transposase
MMGLPSGSRIWLAAGVTDLRKGMDGLSALVQTALQENFYSGQLFVFRGRRGDKLKVLWHSGDGVCLFCKRLSDGRFVWPQAHSGDERRAAIDVAGGHRLAAPEAHRAGAAGSRSSATDAGRIEAFRCSERKQCSRRQKRTKKPINTGKTPCSYRMLRV